METLCHLHVSVSSQYKIAPDTDIGDPGQAAIIRGQILDKKCEGIAGATVDVWYAGGSDPGGSMFSVTPHLFIKQLQLSTPSDPVHFSSEERHKQPRLV